MSHQPERKEKNCLNCGAEIQGRFCHSCGQENIVTHQNFWSLASHFVFDILHFDGKFFHTLLYIFTRPGFVARQYVEGRRMSYLDPIRMYLFTSALFFLIFFSVNAVEIGTGKQKAVLTNEDRQELISDYQKRLAQHPEDSLLTQRIAVLQDTTKAVNLDSLHRKKGIFTFNDKTYLSLEDYDTTQAHLAAPQKDGWLKRKLIRKAITINDKYNEGNELVQVFMETFLHKLPYLLFLSLPFFALILKLLYSRRKAIYYSDHAVFTLYHYIFSFILILVIFGVAALYSWLNWGLLNFLLVLLYLTLPAYLLIEMKRFYGQGWGKTLGKFLLLNVSGLIILLLLFAIFMVFSLFQL